MSASANSCDCTSRGSRSVRWESSSYGEAWIHRPFHRDSDSIFGSVIRKRGTEFGSTSDSSRDLPVRRTCTCRELRVVKDMLRNYILRKALWFKVGFPRKERRVTNGTKMEGSRARRETGGRERLCSRYLLGQSRRLHCGSIIFKPR
jgi:hypothetical protein